MIEEDVGKKDVNVDLNEGDDWKNDIDVAMSRLAVDELTRLKR